MACKSCESGKQKRGICDVHELVDGDTKERLVKWCEGCKAWVCDNCRGDLGRRGLAAATRLKRNVTKYFK